MTTTDAAAAKLMPSGKTRGALSAKRTSGGGLGEPGGSPSNNQRPESALADSGLAPKRVMTTTDAAAAKRTPSGTFARPESALVDSALAPKRVMTTTDAAAAKRTPSGTFARPESALADSGLAAK
jgi:hypothetical protein